MQTQSLHYPDAMAVDDSQVLMHKDRVIAKQLIGERWPRPDACRCSVVVINVWDEGRCTALCVHLKQASACGAVRSPLVGLGGIQARGPTSKHVCDADLTVIFTHMGVICQA